MRFFSLSIVVLALCLAQAFASDDATREFERRFRASGDPSVYKAWISALVRVGDHPGLIDRFIEDCVLDQKFCSIFEEAYLFTWSGPDRNETYEIHVEDFGLAQEVVTRVVRGDPFFLGWLNVPPSRTDAAFNQLVAKQFRRRRLVLKHRDGTFAFQGGFHAIPTGRSHPWVGIALEFDFSFEPNSKFQLYSVGKLNDRLHFQEAFIFPDGPEAAERRALPSSEAAQAFSWVPISKTVEGAYQLPDLLRRIEKTIGTEKFPGEFDLNIHDYYRPDLQSLLKVKDEWDRLEKVGSVLNAKGLVKLLYSKGFEMIPDRTSVSTAGHVYSQIIGKPCQGLLTVGVKSPESSL